METYLTLKGITDVNKSLLLESIVQGVKAFFEWGLLSAGGYATVSVGTPGTNDPYADEVLHPVHQEGIADNRIWEAIHPDWIYETGFTSPAPTVPNGVYVGGTLYPTSTTTGTYKHYMDFPNGRVIFDSSISATSVVEVAYSYKWLHFYDQEVPWFKDVVFDPLVITDDPAKMPDFNKLLKDNRITLPAVIIEPVMTRRLRGVMLGSGAQWVEQDILFHILAERSDDRNNIMDIISLQKDKTFFLFDVNARREASDYPLDWRGSPTGTGKMYPGLVAMPPSGYRSKQCYFSRMVPSDVSLRLPMFRGIVRATLEVDFNSM
jgi:hypothetical protein